MRKEYAGVSKFFTVIPFDKYSNGINDANKLGCMLHVSEVVDFL